MVDDETHEYKDGVCTKCGTLEKQPVKPEKPSKPSKPGRGHHHHSGDSSSAKAEANATATVIVEKNATDATINGNTVRVASPQTSDDTNYVPALVLFVCSLSGLAVLLRKRKWLTR